MSITVSDLSQPLTSLDIEAGTRRSSALAFGRGRVWKWPRKTLKSQRGYEASTMSFFLRMYRQDEGCSRHFPVCFGPCSKLNDSLP
jgi:hypothetical protein